MTDAPFHPRTNEPPTSERGRASLFRARLPAGVSLRVTDDAAHVERVLDELLAVGRAAMPTVSLSAEDFVSYLAERLPENATSVEELRALRIGDLFLACACARGDTLAITLFDSRHLANIGAALRSRDATTETELKQVLREKLFVSYDGARPKIADYSGRGDLASWVRVVAVRTALNLARGTRHEVPLDEDALLAERTGAGVEVERLKVLYRAEFADAFREALGTLSARDRNMLRQHYVDGLTMEQIGTAYRVHRITVLRRLEQARRTLGKETYRLLATRLRLSRTELDSIMRLIRSQLDVSLSVHLKGA